MRKAKDIFPAPADGFALAPVHPGEILKEEIAARGLTANAVALKLRVPANRLTDIVNGKRGISPDTALRLARFFGPGAGVWMTLQSQWDLAEAERANGARIKAEVERAA